MALIRLNLLLQQHTQESCTQKRFYHRCQMRLANAHFFVKLVFQLPAMVRPSPGYINGTANITMACHAVPNLVYPLCPWHECRPCRYQLDHFAVSANWAIAEAAPTLMCHEVTPPPNVIGVCDKLVAALGADAAHPLRAGAIRGTVICLPDALDGGVCFKYCVHHHFVPLAKPYQLSVRLSAWSCLAHCTLLVYCKWQRVSAE